MKYDNKTREQLINELKELRLNEERMKLAMEGANDAFWDLDVASGRLHFSPRWHTMLGFESSEVEHISAWRKLIHRNDYDCVIKALHDHLEGRLPSYHAEYRIRSKSGGWIWVLGRGRVAEYDHEDEPIRVVGTTINITERKKIEEDQLKIQKLESLALLAGGIAHDFNNILTAIMGNISMAELFINSGSKDDMHMALKEAANASMRAKSLSQQLLTFASGGLPVKKVIIIEDFIKEAAGFALKGSNVRCEYSISGDLTPVEVDREQIGQVVQNLIINACQAMPEGGIINVHAENINIDFNQALALKPGKYIKISITDHGTGIRKEHICRIFDPYFSTKRTGSGLGLAVVYSIIKNHGGHIAVQSKKGVGTTFLVYIPSTDKKVDMEIETEKGSFSGQGRILIMDDEEIIRSFVCDGLRHLGYEVESAINGSEAVNIYKRASKSGQQFNAVILDLTIPGGMGGKETVKELLKIDPEANAIVSSGYSNDPIMAEYDKYGFKAVVVKPYKINELSEVVHKVIKRISA